MADADPGFDGTEDGWAKRREDVARATQRAIVELIRQGGKSQPATDMAPAVMRNTPDLYTDPARHDAEVRELFLKQPLVAGLTGDIPKPGDVMLFEGAGPSIIIARGKDGKVRGFLNMCTHRGAKLVRTCSHVSRLTCPFHAWSFDLEGKLVGWPGKDGFTGLEKADLGLVQVPVAEWNGIIFVRADPDGPPIDVNAHLGSFAPEMAQLELALAEPVKNGILQAKSNWKFALDTYGEGYHFATLHASTIGQTHYSNVGHFEPFDRHFRINFPDKSFAALVDLPEAEWPKIEYGGVHYMFPNTVFFIGSIEPGKGFAQIFRLFPGTHAGEMICRFAVYAPRGVLSEQHRAECEFAYDATSTVVDTEDYVIAAEGYQNMLHAPKDFRTTFGRNEPALQHIQSNIARAIGLPLD